MGSDKGSESVEDIYCTLDLNESDIGIKGQSKETHKGINSAGRDRFTNQHIPEEMCEYASVMAPLALESKIRRRFAGNPHLCEIPSVVTRCWTSKFRGLCGRAIWGMFYST